MIPQTHNVDLYAIFTEKLDIDMHSFPNTVYSNGYVQNDEVVPCLDVVTKPNNEFVSCPPVATKQNNEVVPCHLAVATKSNNEVVSAVVATKPKNRILKEISCVKKENPEEPVYKCSKCNQIFRHTQSLNDHVLRHLVDQVDAGVRQQEERANADIEVPERRVKTAKRKYSHMAKSIEFTSPWARWLDRGDHQLCSPRNSWSHHRTSYEMLDQSSSISANDHVKGMPPPVTTTLVPILTWSPKYNSISPPIYKPSTWGWSSDDDDDDEEDEDLDQVEHPVKRARTGFNTEVTTAVETTDSVEFDDCNIDADLCAQIIKIWNGVANN